MLYFGEAAAVLTAVTWSISSAISTVAARRSSSSFVNTGRLLAALASLLLVHLVLERTIFPWGAGGARLAWLLASGLIGFSLGDALGLESYVLLGPRLASAIMISSPVMSALLARVWLSQSLGPAKVAFMLVTLGGILWVVVSVPDHQRHPRLWAGVLLATGSALCQSVGLVFSKFGLEGGFHPMSATLVRVVAGAAGATAWTLLRGRARQDLAELRKPGMVLLVVSCGILSTTVGVGLSLVAIAHAKMGVAATLMSLFPVLLVPISAWVFKERITAGAVAGTLVALAGAAGLFLL